MRIKPITQQVEPSFVQGPAATANLGIAHGFAQLGQELGGASSEWEKVGRWQKRAEIEKQKIDDHDSAFLISTETGEKINSWLDEVKRTDPADHESIKTKGEESLQLILNNAKDQALSKNPEVLRRVNLELSRLSAHANLNLTTIRNEKWKEYHTGELEIYKQYAEDTAPTLPEKVTMPDGTVTYPRQNFMDAYNTKIDEASSKIGFITPKESQKIKQSTRENVSVNTIKLQGLTDPLGTMEKLATGQIGRDLPTDKVLVVNAYLETQLRMRSSAAEKDRIAGEREIKQNREFTRGELQGMVEEGDGENALFHAQALRDQGYWEHEDVTWLRGEIKAYEDMQKKVDVEENNDEIKRIYTLIDNGRFTDAKKLAQETPMKPETYKGVLSEIRGIQNNFETKATTEQKFRHGQGKAILLTSMGIVEGTLIEQIEPVTKEILDIAMREFTNRSVATKGKDDPIDLANEIIPKYQDLLLNRYQMAGDNYEKLLRFKSPQELENSYKSGSITKGEYNSQRDIAIRLNDARQKEGEAKRKRENAGTGKVKK